MPIDERRRKRACDFNARMAGLHGLLRKCQIATNENVDINVRLSCCNLREFGRHRHCSLVQGVHAKPSSRLSANLAAELRRRSVRCNFCAAAASK